MNFISAQSGIGRKARRAAWAGTAYPCFVLATPGVYAIDITINRDPQMTQAVGASASVIYLSELRAGAIKFSFKVPQLCIVNSSNGLWSHTIPSLGLSGYGHSKAESSDMLAADLAVCWDEIAQENDDKLTGDAITLKKKLLAAIKTVA